MIKRMYVFHLLHFHKTFVFKYHNKELSNVVKNENLSAS